MNKILIAVVAVKVTINRQLIDYFILKTKTTNNKSIILIILTVIKTKNVIENCVITVKVEELEGLTEALLVLMVNRDISSHHNHDISLRTREL